MEGCVRGWVTFRRHGPVLPGRARLHADGQSEEGAVSAQKLGQLQPFVAVFPQECTDQFSSFGPT
jgi:hypothetical protein